jgi:parallel beta-helix repeat protein
MPRLKSANFAVTELKNSINDSVTSLTVNDASLFPSEGPFMILVHDSTPGFAGVKELMEVGSINKNTNTLSDILRGRENTPPVAHSAGARVECVWTAGTHAELEDIGNKGKAGGYASLDTTGNIPAEQLGNVEGMEEHGNEWHNPAFATKAELDAHLADSASHSKTARFVIGTSTSGWTSANCDYLCDGTADDVEINAAITALPATGGEVVILDGIYNITASINIPKDNVSLRGSGNATTLKRMYNSTNVGSGPTARGLITLNGKSGCKIQGLQIDGNKATYTASYNYGIYLYSSSSDNTVTGNTCNNNGYGIYLYSSSNDTVTGNTVTGNTCNNNNNGILLDSSQQQRLRHSPIFI